MFQRLWRRLKQPVHLGRVWHRLNRALGIFLRWTGRTLAKAGKGIWWVFSDAARAKTLWRILLFLLALLSAFGVISLDAHWYSLFTFGNTGTYIPFFWRLP